jgi:hypothetical protein
VGIWLDRRTSRFVEKADARVHERSARRARGCVSLCFDERIAECFVRNRALAALALPVMKALFSLGLRGAAVAVAAFAMAACSSRPPTDPHDAMEACASARPGVPCEMSVSGGGPDGDPPVVSRCTRVDDGSLICDSPRLPPSGRDPQLGDAP